jgi:hypothetical protein
VIASERLSAAEAGAFAMNAGRSAQDNANITRAEIAQAVLSARISYMELHRLLGELGEEKKLDLVAVSWIGRGDCDPSRFGDARDLANRRLRHRSADYLLGAPRLADELERGLHLMLADAPKCLRSDALRPLRPAGAANPGIVARAGWPSGPTRPIPANRPNDETQYGGAEIRSARAV